MTDAITSEVNPGPPLVIAQMRSKDRRPPISDRMITVVIAGLDSGRTMCQNLRNADAPSTAEASKYSRGMETIPAMKITVARPTPGNVVLFILVTAIVFPLYRFFTRQEVEL